MTSSITSAFCDHYASLEAGLPGHDLPWLRELRASGLAQFSATGLPTPRWESWKYTNLRDLEKLACRPAQELPTVSLDQAPSLLPAELPAYRLVFVNGGFRGELSTLTGLPEGATLLPLSQAVESQAGFLESNLTARGDGDEQPLLALNTALMAEGLVLHLAPGVTLDRPVEVIFLGGMSDTPLAYHPRLIVTLEDNSAATLIESHRGLGDGAYLSNAVTQVSLARGARLAHVKLQAEGAGAFHIASLRAEQQSDSHFESFGLSIGARLSRNEAAVQLLGSGSDCHVSGSYLMRGKQHCDNTTVIEHKVPRTSCREVFKGVLDDQARAVFQGRIVVHRDAQQTDGHQLSKALLLSDRAEIDAKPELEIYADDVKCSHGATAGDLDGDALFYLRTRGIPEKKARGLLIESFLAEALEEVAEESLRETLSGHVKEWLAETTREPGD